MRTTSSITVGAARQRARRALIGAALVSALAGAAAAPASAQELDVGVSESSTTTSCSIGGPPRPVVGAVGAVVVEKKVQQVGEAFYAAAIIASVDQCYQQNARIEIVPPVGVELAISPAMPVICKYLPNPAAGLAGEDPAAGCPQQSLMGTHGQALLRGSGQRGGLWQLDGMGALQVSFPLRASRPLSGKPSLSCGRIINVSPPCSPAQAGDNLQVGYNVTGARDTWLVPNVGLQVAGTAVAPGTTGAPGSTTSPAPTPPATTAPRSGTTAPGSGSNARRLSLAAPRALRIRRALRGIPVTVQVPAAGTLTAQLKSARLRGVRGGVVARVSRRATRAGALSLRLKPTGKAARALRRARSVAATLTVTFKPSGGSAQRTSARVTLRR